jgi:orotidine-5'-phosphate decarboxylase
VTQSIVKPLVRSPKDRSPKDQLAIALDLPDAARALTLVDSLGDTCQWFKVGMELYYAAGNSFVQQLRDRGFSVFLDLKLHDIPATVARSARTVARLHPDLLTVHASGGPDVIRAATEGAPNTTIAAVTLLTSLSQEQLGLIGVTGSVHDAVLRLSTLAVEAGAGALVCSPQEVSAVRAEVGPEIMLITPGVRPAGSAQHDQARVATPEEAVRAGSDLLVIGRPITGAPDPGAAAAAVVASLRRQAAAAISVIS